MLFAPLQTQKMPKRRCSKLRSDNAECEERFLYPLQPCQPSKYDRSGRPFFDGASIFHFLANLDAHHPAVPRFLARLAQTPIAEGILERFVQIPCGPERDLHNPETVKETLHNPLTYAVFAGNRLVVEWLLTLGANPDCHYINPTYGTYVAFPSLSSWPILYAATCKDTAMLRSLLRRGADVHVARQPLKDRWGFSGPEVFNSVPGAFTPLHLAAYHRRYDSVRLLILHGAHFRRECELADPMNDGYLQVACKPTGRAREAVKLGIQEEHLLKRSSPEDLDLPETAVAEALEEYDAALQAGLGKRRLFVLCCLRERGNLKGSTGAFGCANLRSCYSSLSMTVSIHWS